MKMTLPRDRVFAALDYRSVDMPPVEYHPSPAGLYDHGDKLRALWDKYPQDFFIADNPPTPTPPPSAFDANGRYRELFVDEWGVEWEKLIVGIYGHPHRVPLDDWSKLESYRPPVARVPAGTEFERERETRRRMAGTFFLKDGWLSIGEVMRAVRPYEDVLIDVEEDAPEANRLADMIVEYLDKEIDFLLARGVDAIQIGDDWGTQESLLISPATWRRFYKPRYERLFSKIRKAGKLIFFHSCGYVWPLLEDFAELGVKAIWPQLRLYDYGELHRHCRDLGLAIALHPERGELMTNSGPCEIRREVNRLFEDFEVEKGGAWFYVEIDHCFPWENVEALFSSVAELRRQ